jgi:predicted dehydrogenase
MKNWWPAGHSIGYEHSFTHAIVQFIEGMAAGKAVTPSFEDSARVQAVMEAIERSNETCGWAEVEAIQA